MFTLGLTLANAFLIYLEKNCLENCPSNFKIDCHWQYVDNMFVLFTSQEHLEAFWNFLNSWHVNSWHANIVFSIENEIENRMSFLEYRLFVIKHLYTTSVYCKPTFSGVIHISIAFYHLLIIEVLFLHLLINASKCAQVRLNYTLN